MLRLRDEIFSTGRTGDTAFVGFHYPQTAVPWVQDGMYFSRKVMIMNVATNPAAAETIVVGGKTYTFRVTVTVANEVKIGNLMTNGNFAAGDDGNWYGRYWTVDATGALHTAGVASGTITAFADYRATIGGAVLVTDNAHGLATGDIVTIAGTTNYNGTYEITKVDNNNFYVKPQNGWRGDDATGTWTSVTFTIPLVQEWIPKPIAAHIYTVTYTVAGRTAGTITVSVGSLAGTSRNADGTYAEALTATGDGYLTFTPSVDFDGKISAVTVTDPASDLKALTAAAIRDRINLDTITSLCTAYTGLDKVGTTAEILVIANSIGVTPTFTADGVKVVAAIAFATTITEANLETVAYFKKDITAEGDVKPTVLVERNAGTDNNFLY